MVYHDFRAAIVRCSGVRLGVYTLELSWPSLHIDHCVVDAVFEQSRRGSAGIGVVVSEAFDVSGGRVREPVKAS